MGQLIVNPKTYTGQESEEIFIRPSFVGENAQALGIRVLHNLPVNTTLNFYQRATGTLKPWAKGFEGGELAKKYQKTIAMAKAKVEMGMSPEDYFNTIQEKVVNSANVNLGDLSATQLASIEDNLFREFIAEAARLTMWVGDTTGTLSEHTLFDGFIKKASTYADAVKTSLSAPTKSNIKAAFDNVWAKASETLRSLKSTGKLCYYVTSDVYNAYQDYLDGFTNTAAYGDIQNGRAVLNYHGIEIKEIGAESQMKSAQKQSVIILTHKENLVFALNVKDMPGNTIDVWYDKNEIENRFRATFLASAEILDESLVVFASTKVTA